MGVRTIYVSEHAIDRYIERVAPGMVDRREDVHELIIRLVRVDAHTRPRVPDWVYRDPTQPNEAVGVEQWAVLVELGIAFPLRDGWVLSTLTRAGLSEHQREKRNQRRAHRRAARKFRERSSYSRMRAPIGS